VFIQLFQASLLQGPQKATTCEFVFRVPVVLGLGFTPFSTNYWTSSKVSSGGSHTEHWWRCSYSRGWKWWQSILKIENFMQPTRRFSAAFFSLSLSLSGLGGGKVGNFFFFFLVCSNVSPLCSHQVPKVFPNGYPLPTHAHGVGQPKNALFKPWEMVLEGGGGLGFRV
jgi:hypothetical protein